MPELAHEIGTALGTADGWELLLDPDDKDQQTVLFVYPRSERTTAQGRHWLYQTISSSNLARAAASLHPCVYHYLAENFPDELPDSVTEVPTLAVERTFGKRSPSFMHSITMANCAMGSRAIITMC
jgi:hypothetical protein